MRFAQWLPVALIPEQLSITPVRLDVIDHGSCRRLAFITAHHTQRAGTQKLLACPLPGRAVPALVAAVLV